MIDQSKCIFICKVIILLCTYIFVTNTGWTEDIPQKITHQGVIKKDGKLFTGEATFTFSFSGTNWTETHESLDVNNGRYALQLGSIHPIPYTIFTHNSDVKVNLNVSGENLEPPIEILPVPYAIRAVESDVAKRLKGDSLTINESNQVGIGVTNPQVTLDINGPIRISKDSNSDNPIAGTIRYNGSDFEGFNGSKWLSLTQKTVYSSTSRITAISGESIAGEISPVPVYISKDGVILAQTEADEATAIYGTYYAAQTFRTDAGTKTIKGLWLYLDVKGNPDGNFVLIICDSLLNISNTILQKSVEANGVQSGWNLFMFDTELTVKSNTDYAIVLIASDCNSTNYIEWYYSDNNRLQQGQAFTVQQYYPNWIAHETDFAFKILNDNRLFTCRADDVSTLDFMGFALSNAEPGVVVTVQTTGIVNGFDDLISGEKYYIQNDGSIGNTPGTNGLFIGIATSNQQMSIKNETLWKQDTKGISCNLGNVGIGENKAEAKLQITNIDPSMSPFVVRQNMSEGTNSYYLTLGNIETENGNDLLKTSDGNYLIVGYTGSYGAGDDDIFVIKVDIYGSVIWAVTAGGAKREIGYSAIEDSDGAYIISGETESFGSGNYDVLLLKIDSSGNFVWAKTVGAERDDYGRKIYKTSDNGYIVAGSTNSFGRGVNDALIIKFNSSHHYQWAKNIGGLESDSFSSCFEDDNQNLFLAGYTRSYGAGDYDIFIVKLKNNGSLIWAKSHGGRTVDGAKSICKTFDNGFIIAGDTVSYDAMFDETGNSDTIISKFNNDGSLEWSIVVGGKQSENTSAIQQTLDNGYIVVGYSFGNSQNGLFLYKLNSSGELKWSKIIHGSGSGIHQAEDLGFFITGHDWGYSGDDKYELLFIKTDPEGNISGYENIEDQEIQSKFITPELVSYNFDINNASVNIDICTPTVNHIDCNSSFQYYSKSNGNSPVSDVFVVNSKGQVGIGISDPSYKLHVLGNAYTTGLWESSDQRFKKNITNIKNAISLIMKLKGVTFEWRTDDYPEMDFDHGRQLGLIAQEVETIMPELVHTDANGYKSVSYDKLTALLIEGMKEQQTRLEVLEKKVDRLIEDR